MNGKSIQVCICFESRSKVLTIQFIFRLGAYMPYVCWSNAQIFMRIFTNNFKYIRISGVNIHNFSFRPFWQMVKMARNKINRTIQFLNSFPIFYLMFKRVFTEYYSANFWKIFRVQFTRLSNKWIIIAIYVWTANSKINNYIICP